MESVNIYISWVFVGEFFFLFVIMIDGNISMEEDTELRDLVVQTLENNGVLAKIRVRSAEAMSREKKKIYIYVYVRISVG